MPGRLVAGFRLVALVVLEAAAIPLLLGRGEGAPTDIDWGHLGEWLATTAPEDAVISVVRLVGVALATWLLATTVLYFLARLSRVPALVGSVEWATLPVVRKVVDGAVAASIVSGAVFGAHPAGAQVPPPPPIVVELSTTTTTAPGHRYVPVAAGDTVPSSITSSPPAAPLTTTAAPTTTTTAPAPPRPETTAASTATVGREPVAARAYAEAHVHTVVVGDNLWSIAEADLVRQSGRGPEHLAEVEIRNHWVKLMAANEGRLRSGNPNLIYPGELIVCPPID